MFLIKAFSESELENYTLIIAGYAHPKIVKRFKNSTNIKFIGKVNNLLKYFQAADFFISASLHEGMPNAVLEAMAVGTPVILSNIPSHKEIIKKSKTQIGVIFKNNSFDDLRVKIKFVLKSNYSLLSTNCKLEIKDRFSAIKMAEHYKSLFLSVKNKAN